VVSTAAGAESGASVARAAGTPPDSLISVSEPRLTPGSVVCRRPKQMPRHQFLNEAAAAGYSAVELGPFGYLTTNPEQLRDEHGHVAYGGGDNRAIVAKKIHPPQISQPEIGLGFGNGSPSQTLCSSAPWSSRTAASRTCHRCLPIWTPWKCRCGRSLSTTCIRPRPERRCRSPPDVPLIHGRGRREQIANASDLHQTVHLSPGSTIRRRRPDGQPSAQQVFRPPPRKPAPASSR
jgi:hypothetical protein